MYEIIYKHIFLNNWKFCYIWPHFRFGYIELCYLSPSATQVTTWEHWQNGKTWKQSTSMSWIFSFWPHSTRLGTWVMGMFPTWFSLTGPRCQSLPTSEWLCLSVKIMSATAYSCFAESNVFLLEKLRLRHILPLLPRETQLRWHLGLKEAQSSSLFALNSVFSLSTMCAQPTVGKQAGQVSREGTYQTVLGSTSTPWQIWWLLSSVQALGLPGIRAHPLYLAPQLHQGASGQYRSKAQWVYVFHLLIMPHVTGTM